MSGPTKVVKTKLFIGNLDQSTQTDELTELFTPYGNVLEASVIKDYGFVHYGSIEEAEKAVAALNNKEFHGKRLRVELSTSTVRHRPGQPEPASALRNSRARATAMAGGNGVSRYGSAASTGGVGPMRHNASAWVRNDTRPYDGVPLDPGTMTAGYGITSSSYDRPRHYDARSNPGRYYGDGRDDSYNAGYDITGYAGGQVEMYPPRHYRDLPPHARPDSMGYGPNRPYDRNLGPPAVDPYYSGGIPQGPPTVADPYHGYDPYQKYYATQPHEPEFPGSAGQNPSSRDYDPYANYRNDSYGKASGQGSLRHDLQAGIQQQGVYRPHPSSTTAPNLAQYYGSQQRA